MSKISAVIITYNEEKNIARCLESLKDVVDEIVVLDSFSTDNTQQICIQYGVVFVQQTFVGHIEQKNSAMRLASNDLILSLDADECLSEELKNSILQIKQNKEHCAYSFNRLNFFCGRKIKHGGWYPDKKIRIWNRNFGIWGGKNPHDKVILNNNVEVKQLNGDLLHYTFISIEQHIVQVNKFSSIKAQNDFDGRKKTSFLKALLKPVYKFILIFIIKRGILDGFYGFVIAVNSAYLEYLRQVKLKEKYNAN